MCDQAGQGIMTRARRPHRMHAPVKTAECVTRRRRQQQRRGSDRGCASAPRWTCRNTSTSGKGCARARCTAANVRTETSTTDFNGPGAARCRCLRQHQWINASRPTHETRHARKAPAPFDPVGAERKQGVREQGQSRDTTVSCHRLCFAIRGFALRGCVYHPRARRWYPVVIQRLASRAIVTCAAVATVVASASARRKCIVLDVITPLSLKL